MTSSLSKYTIYPPWVEKYLAIPWSEIHALLSNPLNYMKNDPEFEIHAELQAEYVMDGTITEATIEVLDGDQGGGLIIIHSKCQKITLQNAALRRYADVLLPSPMLEMWNYVGRPELRKSVW